MENHFWKKTFFFEKSGPLKVLKITKKHSFWVLFLGVQCSRDEREFWKCLLVLEKLYTTCSRHVDVKWVNRWCQLILSWLHGHVQKNVRILQQWASTLSGYLRASSNCTRNSENRSYSSKIGHKLCVWINVTMEPTEKVLRIFRQFWEPKYTCAYLAKTGPCRARKRSR